MRKVFFLSDFGLADPYVGIVKAVMEGIAPGISIVDLAHEVPPQDVRRAAYGLYESVPFLPKGSVVLAVVDPGVGSARRAVVVVGERFYVAPDNGLLSLAFMRDPPKAAYLIDEQAFTQMPSATFHARDVFGPAAARLALGVDPSRFGQPIELEELVRLPVTFEQGLHGEILTFDRFGNAITNLMGPLPEPVEFALVAGRTLPFARTYGDVYPGEPVVYLGSAGLVEIAVREGNAREALGLVEGMEVVLYRRQSGDAP